MNFQKLLEEEIELIKNNEEKQNILDSDVPLIDVPLSNNEFEGGFKINTELEDNK